MGDYKSIRKVLINGKLVGERTGSENMYQKSTTAEIAGDTAQRA